MTKIIKIYIKKIESREETGPQKLILENEKKWNGFDKAKPFRRIKINRSAELK